ncbi:unnamed protein product [Didymodactylos carnosus]|uniref:FAD-binding domain-containing protein n=1 Tax=Didymodactylos carnosus TaxID=1234261 RepID=A0A814HXF3_9BILA|nr:unnamed protein product [Didymodactylos carnosus]CAF1127377.1 unnamed protein product [Didymodactylos carnosus]CAF3788886.1 unnamed protein product [Didymodactylos carnosus]CAF3906592.1 unnamed protein product [Didymodactylos carnosus]
MAQCSLPSTVATPLPFPIQSNCGHLPFLKNTVQQKDINSIAIIGGGLGGLCLGQLLKKSSSNLNVTIYERDLEEDGREQGYLIGLNQMGLDVLKRIDHENNLNINSIFNNTISSFTIVDKYLNKLFRVGGDGKHSIKLVDRWQLRKTLSKNLNIKWNKRFLSYEEINNSILVYFDDGTMIQTDILIGCDGAKSRLRKQYCPQLKNEDVCVRWIGGITTQPLNKEDSKLIQLMDNSGLRICGENGHSLLAFIFRSHKTPTIENVLWSLSWPTEVNDPNSDNDNKTYCLAKVQNYFKHPEFNELIENTQTFLGPKNVYSSQPLKKNPFLLSTSKTGRITMLGDAAHPMTTHAGMGANTAFADAQDLADALITITEANLSNSIEIYEEKMFKRGFNAVKQSLQSTRVIHMRDFITNIRDEKVFLVISSSFGEQIMPLIHDLPQLNSVYVFCADRCKHEQWCGQFGKIRSVFTDIQSVCDTLKQDTAVLSHNLITITMLPPTHDVAVKVSNKQEALFMYSTLVNEILVQMKYSVDVKKEMIAFCRSQYVDNAYELKIIDAEL